MSAKSRNHGSPQGYKASDCKIRSERHSLSHLSADMDQKQTTTRNDQIHWLVHSPGYSA